MKTTLYTVLYVIFLLFVAYISIEYYFPLECDENLNMEPIVINTWGFTNATDAAWRVLKGGGSVVDAVVEGCSEAEADLAIATVGFGGSPDELGNTTLDALVMDGSTMEAGAVAAMPNIKDAIRVAREVLRSTRHTMLVGQAATEFAVSRGFIKTDLKSNRSVEDWTNWHKNQCQPNFRRPGSWSPDPTTSCGPYQKSSQLVNNGDPHKEPRPTGTVDENHHDTIGMIAYDGQQMAIGTSTNGATFRVPGRVGDTPIPGAGGYVMPFKNGAAVATGDGDVLMRFLLSHQAAYLVRTGISPEMACRRALEDVVQPGTWYGAVIAMNGPGEFGGACVGFKDFQISVRKASWAETKIIKIPCFK